MANVPSNPSNYPRGDRPCPKCGKPNQAQASHCYNCGAALVPQQPSAGNKAAGCLLIFVGGTMALVGSCSAVLMTGGYSAPGFIVIAVLVAGIGAVFTYWGVKMRR